MIFRERPGTTVTLRVDEPAQNVKNGDNEHPSKSAAKNKKRRGAARKKKDDCINSTGNYSPPPIIQGTHNSDPYLCENNDNLRITGDEVTDKKLRKLNEKLLSIKQLKEQQREGQQLEKTQIEKIGKEKEIIMEIQNLQM